MPNIETDYLVIGAGAAGMGFVDELITNTDAEVVLVDRRHRPAGHWVDGYPFLRLHQASANYGVNSITLGEDRIDEHGPNAGFYERATAGEITEYYTRVLEERFLPSGRVRFHPMSNYLGGTSFRSILTGETTDVEVRLKVVDATYSESAIPSRHTPTFEVGPDVTLVTPNDLVDVTSAPTGFTVLGAGKTSMDTCTWLLEQGVGADAIRWIRPREPWTVDRAAMQPLELVASTLEFQARFMQAGAEASDGADLFRRLEGQGLRRFDPDLEPTVFRAATLSTAEYDALRTIENVVRLGKVLRLDTGSIILTEGTIPSNPGQVCVDCTAGGLSQNPPTPIFTAGRITMQVVTQGIAPWSAATLGYVEATRDDDEEKNRLCTPGPGFTGDVNDVYGARWLPFYRSMGARMAEPDLVAWNERCRLNPVRGAMDRLDDPRVAAAFATLAEALPRVLGADQVAADATT